jgi:hypothetical protein
MNNQVAGQDIDKGVDDLLKIEILPGKTSSQGGLSV